MKEPPFKHHFQIMIRQTFMEMALDEAKAAGGRGEVPVGAAIAGADGQLLARNGNRIVELRDPTAHAEMLVIREASQILQNERLTGCHLYVTLEPCTMCAAAISFARIARLYFGAYDEKAGAVEHGVRFFANAACNHIPDVYGGIAESASASLLREFFASRRN